MTQLSPAKPALRRASLCSVSLRDPGLDPRKVNLAPLRAAGMDRGEWLREHGGEHTTALFEVLYASRTGRRVWVRPLGSSEWVEAGEFQDPRFAPRPGDGLVGGERVVRYKRRDPDTGAYLAVISAMPGRGWGLADQQRLAWVQPEGADLWREVSRPLGRED